MADTTMPVHTPDTQPIPRRTSGLAYRSGDLESSRTAVLIDLRPVPIIPIQSLSAMLPKIHIDVEAVKKSLSKKIFTRGRWIGFAKSPSESKGNENVVFEKLPLLFEHISSAYCNTGTPSAKLINNRNVSPKSQRSNSSRPDSYFLRQPATFAKEKQQGSKDFWEDIAVPLEYKKAAHQPDRNDNERKIIWSMHHIMRNDPCRRFTFGITIEDKDTRVWLCNRAATVVSEAFDFIKDHDHLIKLVCSLAFAEQACLGWDPTLRRSRVENNMVYKIDVHSGPSGAIQTFIADKIISDFGAEATQGRGTRVFRAQAPDGSIVVLKDVWQNDDCDREGDILTKIMDKIRDDKDIDSKASQKLFLTVISHGDVMIDDEKDHTLNLIMRAIDIPADSPFLNVHLPDQIPKENLPRGSVGNVPHVGLEGHKHMGSTQTGPTRIYHRTHYRVVFAELCERIFQTQNLRRIFQALMDGTRALKLLLKYEFVHRDVSAGNILLFDGGGVLADLEYAKHTSSDTTHDVRTGTVYFMAVEVANRKYLFRPKRSKLANELFKHNPLHDLESIWWIAVWVLFMHTLASTSVYDAREQQNTRKQLFPESLKELTRFSVITNDWLDYCPKLVEEFRGSAHCLDEALDILVERYKLAEQGSTIDTTAFDGAHDAFFDILEKARDLSPEGDVQLLDEILRDEPPLKRMRMD